MAASQRAGQSRSVIKGVVSRVHRAWGESPFYQAQLKGPAPDRLSFQPEDPRTPDRALGEAVLSGRLKIGAHSIDCEGELERMWDLAVPGSQLYCFLHDFSWLRHLSAIGDKAVAPARTLTRAWLDRNEKWSPESWEPYLTGERLAQLCCHAALVLRGADALWRSRVLTSMARQTRHLARAGHRAATGYERLTTALGLALATLTLPGCDFERERAIELLRRELRLQVRPDGGHVSRNPSQQLSIVTRLQIVVKGLEARRLPVPGFLKHTIGRMAENVQFFRVGDGRLAVFNGGYEDDSRALLAALQSADPAGPSAAFARHTGFQRLESARAVVIADVSSHLAAGRFESAGSFQFSSGRSRIVVNCGNGAHLPGDWGRALRQAAAHSTLSADAAVQNALIAMGGDAMHRRAEDGRGQLLEIERMLGAGEGRDGPRFMRRFYLTLRGDDFRGEDRLIAPSPALAASWRLRFHLHPSVKISMARDEKLVILALPNREGWKFRVSGASLRLEKSVYCGEGGLPVATQQIVLFPRDLEAAESGDMVVRWAFRRLDGIGAGR